MDSDSKKISIQVFGDLSLDGLFCDPQHHRLVRENMQMVSETLDQCDFRVINWESPIWGNGNMNTLKSPRLSTTELAAHCVLPLNLDVALLANNHAYDCLGEGFDATTSFLDSNKIAHLGASKEQHKASEPLILEKQGIKIGLLNYVGKETNPSLPEEAAIFLNSIDQDRILSDIKKLNATCDYVIVFLHWGKDERVRIPYPHQRTLGRSLIDGGASAVFGGHAHCLQPYESWNGGHIFYCMGNFIFSPRLCLPGEIYSSWDEGGRQVGIATLELSKNKTSVKWDFFYQKVDSLLLQPDDSTQRHNQMKKRCKVLKTSDKALRLKYKMEHILSNVRYQIFSNGWLGTIRKLLNVKKFVLFFKLITGR